MSDLSVKLIRENQTKMQLTSVPANVTPSSSQANNAVPSRPNPKVDAAVENANKLMKYLNQLSGNHDVELDVIKKDHCYTRPSSWRPENIYVKPAKKLFFSKSQSTKDKTIQNEIIDMENSDSNQAAPPIDFSKVRHSMDELHRLAKIIRPDDVEDWEEKVDKVLWSPQQNRIFNRIVRILNSERLARLTRANSLHEPILRRTSIDTNAKRFRETLASVNWDFRITQWLHGVLFDNLSQEYLAIYLDILQTLRQQIPLLVDKMLQVIPTSASSKPTAVTWETVASYLKKSWDPVNPAMSTIKTKKLPGNPILVVIPHGIPTNFSTRQQKWISLLNNLGTVATVNSHLSLNANKMTVMAATEQLVQSTRAKIQELRAENQGRPIVLVGFNTGALLACQIGQLEHVTSIICLGLSFNTVDGKRGTPEDSLLDVRSPIMFVIGQNSILARIEDVEDLRHRMLVQTSLIVIGSADDQLRISTSKKISEKISQSMVDRCILDEIGDFIGSIFIQTNPLPLRNPNSINTYENRAKKADVRKRRNSNCSADSESHISNIKKGRAHSPHRNAIGNNVSGIATNVLPRGTLVTLTGTTSTQTPRRKPRATYSNHSDQMIASRLKSQSSIESSSGGITLNIGSLASLSPVGPIRFEPTSINLQGQAQGKGQNPLKTTNTFIKVSKNNQVISGAQNVAKIKMIMPTKKVAQRQPVTYRNVNLNEKTGESHLARALAPSNTSVKINASTSTVSNVRSSGSGIRSVNSLPSFHQVAKTSANAGTQFTAKVVPSSSNVVPASKTTPTISAVPKPTIQTTPTKVPDSTKAPVAGNIVAQQPRRSQHQDQQSPKGGLVQKTRSPSKRPAPSRPNYFLVTHQEKRAKTSPKLSTAPVQASTIQIKSPGSLEDQLTNILDIPIIIANDGENSAIDTPITIQSSETDNKIILFENKPEQSHGMKIISPTVKYTKIILTKKGEEQNTPVIFAKNNKRSSSNKLFVLDTNSDVKHTHTK